MRLLVAVVLAASVQRAAAAQTTFVEVVLQPSEITVGDHVEAELTLVWDGEAPASPPRFPAWEKTWGRAEVLDVGEVEAVRNAGRRIYTQTLTLTAFETGAIELPRLIVAIPLAAETVEVPTRGGVRLRVESVLPEENEAGELVPRPAAPFRALPGGRRFLWTNAALAGLALVSALVMALRLRRPAPAPPPPAPPRRLAPLAELLQALDEVDAGAGEPAHTAMSLALRRFLGRGLGFPALESTTSEIRRALRHGPLPEDLELTAVDVLRDCDGVKYARLEAGEAVVAERLDLCRDLAHEIDRFLSPPEPDREEG